METVSVKFEEDFLNDIEKTMKEYRYATKAEFIREAVRDKMNDLEKQKSLLRLNELYGAGKEKHKDVSDKELHHIRKKIAHQFVK